MLHGRDDVSPKWYLPPRRWIRARIVPSSARRTGLYEPPESLPVKESSAVRNLHRVPGYRICREDSILEEVHVGQEATERSSARDEKGPITQNLASLEEAEKKFASWRKQFPLRPTFAIGYARLAQRRRDWSEALSRWEYVRDHFPEVRESYHCINFVLQELGKIEEADNVLGVARERFSDWIAIAIAYANVAEKRRDLKGSLSRWRFVQQNFPDQPHGYRGVARLLKHLNRLVDGEELYAEARDRFPDNSAFAILYAQTAERRRDLPEALARWKYVSERFPALVDGHWGLARALRDMGRFDEANQLFVETWRRFPDGGYLAWEYLNIAIRRRDWPEVFRRSNELKTNFPNSKFAVWEPNLLVGHARLLAEMDRIDQSESLSTTAGDALSVIKSAHLSRQEEHPENALIGELLMKFESMGNNCELGIIQRHFGAEPIGLLRWSGTPPSLLAAAISAGFDGYGQPEHTKLDVRAGQFFLQDSRYKTMMHTFVYEGDVSPDRFYPMMMRRMQYLARKFIEDLRDPQKIFVYRARGLPLQELRAMHRAMRAYGSCTLMGVDEAQTPDEAGHITVLDDGLLLGKVDRLWNGIWETPSYASWISLCRRAYQVWHGEPTNA